MKKPLSLYEQVQAAKQKVDSWPESVKSVTDIRFSDFFPNTQKAKLQSTDREAKEQNLEEA